MSKLTTGIKTEIAFSNKSTRELGVKYGVHHSTPANIKKEAKTAVFEHFEDRKDKIGRPAEEIDQQQVTIKKLSDKVLELEIEMQLKDEHNALMFRLANEESQVKKKRKF